jgi:phosphoglycolate phosphatase
MRLVLFDCDGTLADSFGLICETMRRCFLSAGLPEPELSATQGIIGLSLDRAIHQLAPTLTSAELPGLVELYRQEFHKVRAEGTFPERLFPGVEPLLRRLALRDDLLLGMVTGKSRRGVRLVVDAHGLEGIFPVVRTADDCPSKPHPAMVLECCAEMGVDPGATVVVGDAVFDMQMARAAGADALGVSWGAQDPATLLASGASAVAFTVDDLADRLEAWIARDPETVPLVSRPV